jgi:DNA-binding XRE family transcriptional regulator
VKELYADFGASLRMARKRAGLSQDDLARRVGLSRTSITNIEGGRQQVLLHTFIGLCRAVGKDPESMVPTGNGLGAFNRRLGLKSEREGEWVARVVAAVAADSTERTHAET